ncbi:MAG: DUF2127 domain-containing protein [Variovorax paradoxus]|uniref:DUF2127 domain-containing protein n=1 Tax=Variovorax paradoxus TaxID=34073 RepID=A0A2W5NVL1_VARPD|nr:MAG: DUF2127 domain-containing protein [Variovorax paradoxus]
MRTPTAALRTVALFEAFKGVLALAAASGLLTLLHGDLHGLAVRLVHHLHLNPAAHYPHVQHLQDSRLGLLALGAFAYGALRLVEAYGLLRNRAWAEWLSAASGAIYVPFELAGLLRHADALHAVLLVANLAVVAVMVLALWRRPSGEVAPA